MARGRQRRQIIEAYCDGSSLRNGRWSAAAGWGVVLIRPSRVDQYRARLSGKYQTNNRAELTAILKACELAPKNADLQIFTDSQYAINCLTEWVGTWEQNGWRTYNGNPVKNADLIREILVEMDYRPLRPELNYIPGHSNHRWNDLADELAREGARMFKPNSPYNNDSD